MPSVCGGCLYVDCLPDCLDRGCCGACCDVLCCRARESSNFSWNDPARCCCGLCARPSCCTCENDCRKLCMCRCCGGNCIVDPCACVCGEYKGNLGFAEKEMVVIQPAGAPPAQEITR